MALNPKKLSVLHVGKKYLMNTIDMTEEQYRSILYEYGNRAESGKDLSEEGFRNIMRIFTRLGFRSDWSKRNYGERRGMATPAQIDMIRSLWQEYSGEENETALNNWLEHSYKVSALRFLSQSVAGKAINGLKAMKRRKSYKSRKTA